MSRPRKPDPQDPYVIDGVDTLRAAEASMTPAARESWLLKVGNTTPGYVGSAVADVLESLSNNAAYMALVETWLGNRGGELREELKMSQVATAVAARAAIAYDVADYELRAEALMRAMAVGKKRAVSFD